MLCLSRKAGEGFVIGPDIRVVVVKIENGQAVIGIDAPREVVIMREELLRKQDGTEDPNDPGL